MKNEDNEDVDDAWGFTLADICLTLMIVVVITVVSVPAINSFSTTVIEKEITNDIFWKFSVNGADIFVNTGDGVMQPIKESEIADCIIRIQQNNSDSFNGALQVSMTISPESSSKTVNILESSIYMASQTLGYKISPFISKTILPSAQEQISSSE